MKIDEATVEAAVEAEVDKLVVKSTAASAPKVLDAAELANLADQSSAAPRPKAYADQKTKEKQEN